MKFKQNDWLLSLVACWVAVAAQSVAESSVHQEFTPKAVFNTIPFDKPFKVTPAGRSTFVLDRSNHRVLQLDEDGSVQKQIGRIGQGEDELHYPTDFHVGTDGTIFVITETIPFKYKIFNPDGGYRGGFDLGATIRESRAAFSLSLGMDSKSRIYLNQPELGSGLVTIYDLDGKRLGQFGEKLNARKVHGLECEDIPLCTSRRYETGLNRVQIFVDSSDNVYTAFNLVPIIRKYGPDRDLVYETHLDSAHVNDLMSRKWSDRSKWKAYSYTIDGFAALIIMNGVSVDPVSGRAYCLVGSKEIHVLSPDGENEKILRPGDGYQRMIFDSISAMSGELYLTNWSGIFEVHGP